MSFKTVQTKACVKLCSLWKSLTNDFGKWPTAVGLDGGGAPTETRPGGFDIGVTTPSHIQQEFYPTPPSRIQQKFYSKKICKFISSYFQ
jgi:hypothetical protein